MHKIKVISEIGSNHNGNIELAKKMIDASIECGADAVKFQTFKAEELVSVFAPMAKYQKENLGKTDSQIAMLKKLELSQDDYVELFAYAKERGVEMFSTPFDIVSVDFLHSVGMKLWKIPSGEITNLPYLEHIAALDVEDKHIVLSTGMASLEETKAAVAILEKGCDHLTIMHCTTNYPALDEDLNLEAIHQLQELFPNCDIGFSDHSAGITASIVACGMGITMIEKHFTLSKMLPGPDHKMSMDPAEMKALCEGVRRAELMLGARAKTVVATERPNRVWARKSIVARVPIAAGEVFTKENLTTKRPGTGISPMQWHELLGKTAEQDFAADEMIRASGFDWIGAE